MYYLKRVSLICLVAIGTVLAKHHEEEHQKPHYQFEYGVHDPHTHDHKSHYEHRDGDHVHGAYMLKEPDGTTRVVKYTVGPKSGFQAHVERIGHAHHPSGGHHHHGGSGGQHHHAESDGHHHHGGEDNSENYEEGPVVKEHAEGENQEEGESRDSFATWGPFGF